MSSRNTGTKNTPANSGVSFPAAADVGGCYSHPLSALLLLVFQDTILYLAYSSICLPCRDLWMIYSATRRRPNTIPRVKSQAWPASMSTAEVTCVRSFHSSPVLPFARTAIPISEPQLAVSIISTAHEASSAQPPCVTDIGAVWVLRGVFPEHCIRICRYSSVLRRRRVFTTVVRRELLSEHPSRIQSTSPRIPGIPCSSAHPHALCGFLLPLSSTSLPTIRFCHTQNGRESLVFRAL